MTRDPMRILSMLRRHTVEQARQVLASCAHAEAQAADRIRLLDEAAERDREAAKAAGHAHQFIEMSALRQAAAKAERERAKTAWTQAAARSASAHQDMVSARTAAEAVNTLIEEHAIATEAEASRRTQHTLDDMSRGLPAANRQNRR